MLIGGNKFLVYMRWITRKKIQTFIRAHLSHVLAISLGTWAFIREFPELKLMIQSFNVGWRGLLGLVLIVGTICAAMWELFGNKRSSSKQEARFVAAMLSLLQELEKFTYGRDKEQNIDKRLDTFIEGFLEITQTALGGTKELHGGLMIADPGTHTMRLVKSSRRAYFPDDYVVPLPDPNITETSPVAVAYETLQVVYMPQKSTRLSFPFRLIGEQYEPSEPTSGWVASNSPEMETFRSVLCLPVTIYKEKNTKAIFGVLIYGTSSPDPFNSRDFMMGECFSSVLALAFAAAQREASEVKAEPKAKNVSSEIE